MSKALGMAILQVAGRDTADPGHSGAGDIGIEVLIEHPDNLAAPPHGRDQIHPRRPGRGIWWVTRCPAGGRGSLTETETLLACLVGVTLIEIG